MSAPARTYFCENGHITEEYGHGIIGEDFFNEGIRPCVHCKSKKIYCCIEWGDTDYLQKVPTTPIGQDEFEKEDHRGNKYYMLVNKYDVSELLKRKEIV